MPVYFDVTSERNFRGLFDVMFRYNCTASHGVFNDMFRYECTVSRELFIVRI